MADRLKTKRRQAKAKVSPIEQQHEQIRSNQICALGARSTDSEEAEWSGGSVWRSQTDCLSEEWRSQKKLGTVRNLEQTNRMAGRRQSGGGKLSPAQPDLREEESCGGRQLHEARSTMFTAQFYEIHSRSERATDLWCFPVKPRLLVVVPAMVHDDFSGST